MSWLLLVMSEQSMDPHAGPGPETASLPDDRFRVVNNEYGNPIPALQDAQLGRISTCSLF